MKRILMVSGLLILSAILVVFLSLSLAGQRDSESSQTPSDIMSDNISFSTEEFPPFDSSVDFSVEVSDEESSAEASVQNSSAEASSEEDSSPSYSSEESSSEAVSSALPESSEPSSTDSSESDVPVMATRNEIRAAWVSYIDMASIIKDCSEAKFKSNFETVCKNASDYGLNTLYVHVRPFSDAYYRSAIFPWSHTITGTQGKDPGFDPLTIMVDVAHRYNLRIEAWINPYRVATSNFKLDDSNPAKAWMDTDKVQEVSGKYFYNPASNEVMDLVVSGVEEIVKNYDVDGIHFDDYFYPTTDTSFDEQYYADYKAAGGKESLAEFRRQNVTKLLKKTYHAIKAIDSDVVFGISPNGKNTTNYNELYLDVESVITNGCIDYICPQIYFGFEHGSLPFESTVVEWEGYVKNSSVELYIGLAAYKVGVEDTWAGKGKTEWLQHTDILKRQVTYLHTRPLNKGFALYSYNSLFAPAENVAQSVKKEKDNLYGYLNS